MSFNNGELTIEEKMKFVLDGLVSGVSREELAKSLGYGNWRGIDSLFRRRGYIFKNGIYVQPQKEKTGELDLSTPNPIRIALRQLDVGERDLSTIAEKAGFKNRTDLANYMRGHGWIWDSEKGTYVVQKDSGPDNMSKTENYDELQLELVDNRSGDKERVDEQELGSDLNGYGPMLQFLEENLEKLEVLLASVGFGRLPHYSFHTGNVITKSVSMSSNLDLLIRDFSADKGVSQRIILEAALIQFMQKHGYSKEVEMLLNV